jgi:hypothetical protein
MGRPKSVKNGTKLNIYLPEREKRFLFKLATARRKSMSAVITDLIIAEVAKPAPCPA